MKKFHKLLIGISLSLLVILGLLDNSAFVKRETIHWDSEQLLNWDNFRGYPVLFNKYSAAILSLFDYEILNESQDSIRVSTFMHSNHSWVREFERESEEGLRHEQYHFNISEVMARRYRKVISELPKSSLNKNTLKTIYRQHFNELNRIQDKYDTDTDHSLIVEAQKDWEYLVDSMLNSLEYYKDPLISFTKAEKIQHTFYREIDINAFYEIYGKFPMDSATAKFSKHYKFYYNNDKLVKVEHWNRNKLESDEFYKVAKIEIEANEKTEEWSFYNTQGKKSRNDIGVHRYYFERTETEILKQHYGLHDDRVEDNNGVHQMIWSLDHKKRQKYGRYFNKNLQQVVDNDGFYIIEYKYDKNDNLIEVANYDENKELKNINNGVAYYRYNYDSKNNMTDLFSFNSEHELYPHHANIASRHFNYDLNGNVIRKNLKTADGMVVLDENRAAISYFRYDKYSNLIEERFYGQNKNLIIRENNNGKVICKYDSLGRIIESQNYDAYDNFLNNNRGVCLVKTQYDSTNLIIEEEQYYRDSLMACEYLRTVHFEYDKNRNVIRETYLDLNGEIKTDTNGIASKCYKYDESNNLLQIDHYNETGELQAYTQGIATFKYKYDSRGNKVEAAYFGENTRLRNGVDNVAIDRYVYDDKNRRIERSYYDSNGFSIKGGAGVEVIRWTFDSKNNIVSESYYNRNGERIIGVGNVAYMEFLYDDKNNHVESRMYNLNHQLVDEGNNGIAIIKFSYSDDGNLIRKSYYNKEGMLKNLPEGYAIEQNQYDYYNNLVKINYLSDFKQPVVTSYGYASIEWGMDHNENVVVEIYKDENDELIEDEEGIAIYNWIYNRNGETIGSYGFNLERNNLAEVDYGAFMSSVESFFSYTYFSVSPNRNTRLQTTYFDNGQKESEVLYIEGRQDGTCTFWYETGEIESTIEYENGFRNGYTTEYYKNGQKAKEMKYDNNMLIHNSELTWHENGRIRSEYEDGEYIEYNEDGVLISD